MNMWGTHITAHFVVTFDPVWVNRYPQSYMFGGIHATVEHISL